MIRTYLEQEIIPLSKDVFRDVVLHHDACFEHTSRGRTCEVDMEIDKANNDIRLSYLEDPEEDTAYITHIDLEDYDVYTSIDRKLIYLGDPREVNRKFQIKYEFEFYKLYEVDDYIPHVRFSKSEFEKCMRANGLFSRAIEVDIDLGNVPWLMKFCTEARSYVEFDWCPASIVVSPHGDMAKLSEFGYIQYEDGLVKFLKPGIVAEWED